MLWQKRIRLIYEPAAVKLLKDNQWMMCYEEMIGFQKVRQKYLSTTETISLPNNYEQFFIFFAKLLLLLPLTVHFVIA